MDEPVANLDPKARLEFFNTLKEVKKLGVTVFISSHVLAELEIYFDSLTILDGGKIVFSGTKEKLYEKFNDCRYSINTSNNKLLLTFLKNNKYEIKGANNNMINVIANNKQGLLKIQNFINNHKLKIEHFNKNQPSLNEIYDELVVKGSVDTMKS
jgi:ABC-2 type transport system ATP-binding protein